MEIKIGNPSILQTVWPYLTEQQKQDLIDNDLINDQGQIVAAIDNEIAFNITLYGRGSEYNGRINAKRVIISDENVDGSYERILAEEPEQSLQLTASETRTIIGAGMQLFAEKVIPFLVQVYGKMPNLKPAVSLQQPSITGLVENNQPKDLV